MLWAYEIRVMFALFMVKLSQTFVRWAEDNYRNTAERAAEASRIPIPKDPYSVEAMKRSQKVMAALEAQEDAEQRWVKAQKKLEAREKKHEQLNSVAGRQIPGTIATIQTWILAGVLTYFSPEWAVKMATFLHLTGGQ